jgi:hypothetical protein
MLRHDRRSRSIHRRCDWRDVKHGNKAVLVVAFDRRAPQSLTNSNAPGVHGAATARLQLRDERTRGVVILPNAMHPTILIVSPQRSSWYCPPLSYGAQKGAKFDSAAKGGVSDRRYQSIFSLSQIDHQELLAILTLRYKTCWLVSKDEISFPASEA